MNDITKNQNLDDFGEVIQGAKKHNFADLDLTNADTRKLPFSKLWAKSEIDAIEDVTVAAIAHHVRNSMPAKPRKPLAQKNWFTKLENAQTTVAWLVARPEAAKTLIEKLEAGGWNDRVSAFAIQMMAQTDRKHWDKLAFDIRGNSFLVRAGEENHKYSVADVSTTNIAEVVTAMKSAVDASLDNYHEQAPKQKAVQFSLYRNNATNEIFVAAKPDKEKTPLMYFDSPTEARDYLYNEDEDIRRENLENLNQLWQEHKELNNIVKADMRSAVNAERTGASYRDGRDVSPEEFMQTFGIRGGQFGNWVKGDERQAHLNQAYDAFMDLSKAANIPPSAIGLNGELGIAFGARGSGWAAAHYETAQKVINLTKTKGAGSLAHEWWHALDHYLGGKDLATRDTNSISPENMRHAELSTPLQTLLQATRNTELYKRSFKADGSRSKAYFSTDVEMTARAFERYVANQLEGHAIRNDYLVNIIKFDDWQRNSDAYVYPKDDELEAFSRAYDHVFDKLAEVDKSFQREAKSLTTEQLQELQSNLDRINAYEPDNNQFAAFAYVQSAHIAKLPSDRQLAASEQALEWIHEVYRGSFSFKDMINALPDQELAAQIGVYANTPKEDWRYIDKVAVEMDVIEVHITNGEVRRQIFSTNLANATEWVAENSRSFIEQAKVAEQALLVERQLLINDYMTANGFVRNDYGLWHNHDLLVDINPSSISIAYKDNQAVQIHNGNLDGLDKIHNAFIDSSFSDLHAWQNPADKQAEKTAQVSEPPAPSSEPTAFQAKQPIFNGWTLNDVLKFKGNEMFDNHIKDGGIKLQLRTVLAHEINNDNNSKLFMDYFRDLRSSTRDWNSPLRQTEMFLQNDVHFEERENRINQVQASFDAIVQRYGNQVIDQAAVFSVDDNNVLLSDGITGTAALGALELQNDLRYERALLAEDRDLANYYRQIPLNPADAAKPLTRDASNRQYNDLFRQHINISQFDSDYQQKFESYVQNAKLYIERPAVSQAAFGNRLSAIQDLRNELLRHFKLIKDQSVEKSVEQEPAIEAVQEATSETAAPAEKVTDFDFQKEMESRAFVYSIKNEFIKANWSIQPAENEYRVVVTDAIKTPNNQKQFTIDKDPRKLVNFIDMIEKGIPDPDIGETEFTLRMRIEKAFDNELDAKHNSLHNQILEARRNGDIEALQAAEKERRALRSITFSAVDTLEVIDLADPNSVTTIEQLGFPKTAQVLREIQETVDVAKAIQADKPVQAEKTAAPAPVEPTQVIAQTKDKTSAIRAMADEYMVANGFTIENSSYKYISANGDDRKVVDFDGIYYSVHDKLPDNFTVSDFHGAMMKAGWYEIHDFKNPTVKSAEQTAEVTEAVQTEDEKILDKATAIRAMADEYMVANGFSVENGYYKHTDGKTIGTNGILYSVYDKIPDDFTMTDFHNALINSEYENMHAWQNPADKQAEKTVEISADQASEFGQSADTPAVNEAEKVLPPQHPVEIPADDKGSKLGSGKSDAYLQKIADRILEQVKNNEAPWQKPFEAGTVNNVLPVSGNSGKTYQGLNLINLMAVAAAKGYDDNRWYTYNNAKAAGGQVRLGEKGTQIHFWQHPTDEDVEKEKAKAAAEGREPKRLSPMLRIYTVFNAKQIDGLPERQLNEKLLADFERHEKAESILENSGVRIEHTPEKTGYYSAHYSPRTDTITLPQRELFVSADAYYATALHELAHATGHESRLNRDLSGAFGSYSYAKEELRAEMASMMIGQELQLGHDPSNHYAYLQSWAAVIENDPKEFFKAVKDADLITNYVLNLDKTKEKVAEVEQKQDAEQAAEVVAQTNAVINQNTPHGVHEVAKLDKPLEDKVLMLAEQSAIADKIQSVDNEQLKSFVRGIKTAMDFNEHNHKQLLDLATYSNKKFDAREFALHTGMVGDQGVVAYDKALQDLADAGILKSIDDGWKYELTDEAAYLIKQTYNVVEAEKAIQQEIPASITNPEPVTEAVQTADQASEFGQSVDSAKFAAMEYMLRNNRHFNEMSEQAKHQLLADINNNQSQPLTVFGVNTLSQVHPDAWDKIKITQEDDKTFMVVAESSDLALNHHQTYTIEDRKDLTNVAEAAAKSLRESLAYYDDKYIQHQPSDIQHAIENQQQSDFEKELQSINLPEGVNCMYERLNEDVEIARLYVGEWRDDKLIGQQAFIDKNAKFTGYIAKYGENEAQIYNNLQFAVDVVGNQLAKDYAADIAEYKRQQAIQSAPPAPQGNITAENRRLFVPYEQKDVASALGARWDKDNKTWYAPAGSDLDKFKPWLKEPVREFARPEDEFARQLEAHGLRLEAGHPIMDGQWHRLKVEGDRTGSKSGAYIGHLDGVPRGTVKNYKTSQETNWTAKDSAVKSVPSSLDIERAKAAAEAKQKASYNQAADAAKLVLNHAQPAQNHPYLDKKGVAAHGVYVVPDKSAVNLDNTNLAIANDWREAKAMRENFKANGVEKQVLTKGDLIVPAINEHGDLRTFQTISGNDGSFKSFVKGGEKSGSLHVIGDLDNAKDVMIAEGYATAATLHEQTGKPVVVAFDAGNLSPVAEKVRAALPEARIYIAADNDRNNAVNTGIEKANAAAEKVDAKVIVPQFDKLDGADKLSDWNDLHKANRHEFDAQLATSDMGRQDFADKLANLPPERQEVFKGWYDYINEKLANHPEARNTKQASLEQEILKAEQGNSNLPSVADYQAQQAAKKQAAQVVTQQPTQQATVAIQAPAVDTTAGKGKGGFDR